MHHSLQKAFERKVFQKNRFHKWSESRFYKVKGVLKRAQTEKSLWKGLKSTQILKTKFIYFIIIIFFLLLLLYIYIFKIFVVKDFKSRVFETLLVF